MRFVDTSFWVALRFARDQRHPSARALWEAGAGSIITTPLVLGETWTYLRRRASHRHALDFFRAVTQLEKLAVRHVDDDIEADAWRWLGRHDGRAFSFVDATSFSLMRRLRIREALAFDGDFSAAGFIEVRPS